MWAQIEIRRWLLELQAAESCPMWLLAIVLGSYGRTICAFNASNPMLTLCIFYSCCSNFTYVNFLHTCIYECLVPLEVRIGYWIP